MPSHILSWRQSNFRASQQNGFRLYFATKVRFMRERPACAYTLLSALFYARQRRCQPHDDEAQPGPYRLRMDSFYRRGLRLRPMMPISIDAAFKKLPLPLKSKFRWWFDFTARFDYYSLESFSRWYWYIGDWEITSLHASLYGWNTSRI